MENRALLIIDVQKGFDEDYWGKRNNLNAEENILKLLVLWRKNKWTVIHIRHCSTNPNSPLFPSSLGNQFKDETSPVHGEIEIKKNENSAFIGTELEFVLRKNNINDLVIVGLTTDHCVSTTTRMAGNLSFNVVLVADATATFDRKSYDGLRAFTADEMHDINLASLHDEFCEVMTTEKVILENNKPTN